MHHARVDREPGTDRWQGSQCGRFGDPALHGVRVDDEGDADAVDDRLHRSDRALQRCDNLEARPIRASGELAGLRKREGKITELHIAGEVDLAGDREPVLRALTEDDALDGIDSDRDLRVDRALVAEEGVHETVPVTPTCSPVASFTFSEAGLVQSKNPSNLLSCKLNRSASAIPRLFLVPKVHITSVPATVSDDSTLAPPDGRMCKLRDQPAECAGSGREGGTQQGLHTGVRGRCSRDRSGDPAGGCRHRMKGAGECRRGGGHVGEAGRNGGDVPSNCPRAAAASSRSDCTWAWMVCSAVELRGRRCLPEQAASIVAGSGVIVVSSTSTPGRANRIAATSRLTSRSAIIPQPNARD